MQRLIVIGAGGYGRAVAESAAASGLYEVVGFVDDRWPALPPVWDLPILGSMAQLPSLRDRADAAVVAIGDNLARSGAGESLLAAGIEAATVIHPRAFVSPRARIGKGVSIMAGAVIGTEAQIDDGVIVNAGATIDHHARVGRYAHVGIGACVGGAAVLQPGGWLKAGCVLPPGQTAACEPPPGH